MKTEDRVEAGEDRITLGQMFDFAQGALPFGWWLSLTMGKAAVDLSLTDPDGCDCEVYSDHSTTSSRLLADYVNAARATEGMEKVDWPFGG